MKEKPIGIFDSGIGGLTIANSIKKNLPNESIIYFGDTEHLPYGEKSQESIKLYSKKIIDFLVYKKCKIIICACNSASSALNTFVYNKSNNIKVYNVIDPIISEVANKYANNNIGVIGTKATIGSNVYADKLKSYDKNIKVSSLATPLLAPMIEENFINGNISNIIIRKYLENNLLKKINCLILACTHYPLIYKEICNHYKDKNVQVINPTKIISSYIKYELKKYKLQSNEGSTQYKFYISNYTKSFAKSAKLFFKQELDLEQVNLWTK